MDLDWERLLCEERLHGDATAVSLRVSEIEAPRTAAEADVQRVIFSAPFRRLAGKTQVHPFARVDYVHNRLTHSLEVAEAGSGLASAVASKLELSPEVQRACRLHVRAACLGHDIGNPPYGHVGEAMLRDWTRNHASEILVFLEQKSEVLDDFLHFDGNAQTFRLLAHPQPDGNAYFRLTCASLGAMVKYPARVMDTQGEKFACFQHAYPWFDCVMTRLGLRFGEGMWQRHPLSYLTEIADDICYCVTDCEDAVLMGILDEETVCEWYLQLFSASGRKRVRRSVTVSSLRAMVIGDLMTCFAKELATAFRHPDTLVTFELESPTWQRLKLLKDDYKIVFADARKQEIEADARIALGRVMDALFEDICAYRAGRAASARLKMLMEEPRLKNLRSQMPVEVLHTLFDTITDMTDAYVQHFASKL